ncbi:arylsulfatase [Conexibacter woesei]|uniref:Sulfatase n=1 Tax=Conexibacter woesei (strain DSM 14684 / CCUG 47730 / CIP 108061 / JCM 11494 / NBRC 100937 / ID131577) TaxID=469383 RepID=D3FCX2_CONWI|nr:arylsulfatase [Conexibacter woesei]ADB51484.1 sulfatase [Conexibacter woesei DSM 14684]
MSSQSNGVSLPKPDQVYSGPLAFDVRELPERLPAIEAKRPPRGAPNVLIMLLDDVGFGASSTFGGPIHTPTAERLAGSGLRYSRFHTTSLCSPTRAALLSGRNHHAVGMGHITETATPAPGYRSTRPNSATPLAEILRQNGYNTAQFGKCHEVPVWESGPTGPFDHWPVNSGFERFFGFIGGETNQFTPALVDGTSTVEPPDDPDYHLMTDLADRTIAYVREQQSLTPDKPFFAYLAPGATHTPHHVPRAWIHKYKGQFDDGWDALRERSIARQRELGVVAADCELTRRPDGIAAWADVPAEWRPILSRQMEVYAAFLEYADTECGRVLDALEELGVLDDTLVLYIIGDNGASAEGGLNGAYMITTASNGGGEYETPQFWQEHLSEVGGPRAYNHYSVAWAHALCAPYQWTKQVASHYGGTRNGTIVHWPARIRASGEVRTQWHHVIDVAPTILELAGIAEPDTVNGVTQVPMQGVSFAYSFDDADADERHHTQYFELMGNRGIYHRGWTAVTKHRTPWDVVSRPHPFDADVWELYDTTSDWSQARDLSAEQPAKLAELQQLFLIEAVRHNVLPLDDRAAERMNPEIAGRPTLVTGDRLRLYPGMKRLGENVAINVKNRSYSVTAEVEVETDGSASGALVAQGGRTGGWALLVTDGGRLAYHYNYCGLRRATIESSAPIAAGRHQLRAEFGYDGGGIGRGGSVTLFVDGSAVGEGRVERTHPLYFSFDEGLDVGLDSGMPVFEGYAAPRGRFGGGSILWAQIDLGGDDHNHLVPPEAHLQAALIHQ